MTIPKSDDKKFTASDVMKVTGMTYRQIRHFDAEGLFERKFATDESWRKFASSDMFAMMVCVEILERFSIPLTALDWVKEKMTHKDANFIANSERLMHLGHSAYLLTDLKKSMLIESDVEILDLYQTGYFRASRPQGYIFIKLNDVVNELRRSLDFPALKVNEDYREDYGIFDGGCSEKELEVLRAIRKGTYDKITLHLKDGEVLRLEQESKLPDTERAIIEKEMTQAIKEHKYQDFKITVRDGKLVHVSRNVVSSLNSVTGKTEPKKKS